MIKTRNAFVVMELIPALALLMLALVAALRLVWLGLESVAGAERLQLSVEALAACGGQWPAINGEVLLVWIDPKGDWHIKRFPDRDWLPEVRDRRSFVFRWVHTGTSLEDGFWISEEGFETE